MKKICSMILTLLIIISVIYIPQGTFAKEANIEFFTNIGFADTASYAPPQGMSLSGKQYVAKVLPGGIDKMLYMKNQNHKLTALAPVSIGQDMYYIQIRLKANDTNSKKTIGFISGSDKINALTVDINKSIVIGNDKYGVIKINSWIDLGFMIDPISGKGDVYIDGRLVKSRFNFGTGKIASIVFESASSQKETVWCVDYIRSYSHDKLLLFNEYQYQLKDEAKEDSSLELPAITKTNSQLIVGYDFEEDAQGSVPDGFWTKNKPYIDIRDDGEGKAFKVERVDLSISGENYIDLLTNVSFESVIVETDVYNSKNQNPVKLFTLRDKPGNFASMLTLYTDGTVKTNQGLVVAKGLNEKWTNLAVAIDFTMRTFSVYTDRILVAEDISIPSSTIEDYIQLVRFEMQAGASKGTVWYDNMFVYTGDELQPYSENMKKQREEDKLKAEEEEKLNGPKGEYIAAKADLAYFTPVEEMPSASPSDFLGGYESAKESFKEAFCLVGGVANVMIEGKKYTSPTPTLWENSKILVPVRMLGAAYDFEISYDSQTETVSLGDDIKLRDGDNSFVYKDKKVELTTPVKIQNGVTYIEFAPFVKEVINGFMYQSDYGIAVVSSQKLGYGAEHEALRYLVYDRPNAAYLLDKLNENHPGNSHPRVYFSKEDFERALNMSTYDTNVMKWSDTVMKSADSLIKSSLPKMAYDTAGLRLQNLLSNEEVLNLYWAYLKTSDEKYSDYAIASAKACCTEYTTWGHDTHYLEVGQATGAVGLVYDLFYDKISIQDKELIQNTIVEYGLKPSLERYHGKNKYNGLQWPTNPNNWNIVVNKGIIMGALAIAGDYENELCMDILEKSIKSIEYMMPTFAPEGAWGEGPSYWDYTVSNTVIAIKALQTAFGDDFGISDTPGFMDTGYYPFNLSGNGGLFAFHDSPRIYKLNGTPGVFHLAKMSGNTALAGLQLYTMNKNKAPGNVFNIMYYDPAYVSEPEGLDLDVLYSSSQVALTRSSWGTGAVWAAIHAGANDFAHGHVDLGTFEYEADGVRFASEMGKDDYNLPGYWSTTVRNLYVTRAEGHNVYVINPDTGAGQDVRASSEIKEISIKDKGSIYTIDMTPAYSDDVEKATRGFKLSDNRRVFTVQDEIIPKGNDEYYWFWHTVADIDISDDGKSVVLTNGSRKVNLYFDSNVDFTVEKGLSVPLATSPIVDGQLTNMTNVINKITVKFKSVAGTALTFRATAIPSGCKFTPEDEITAISDWTIPDGDIDITYPEPDAILMDGTAIDGFNPDITDYSVPMYKVPDTMPEITLSGVEKYTVTQPTMDNPTAIIEIPSNTNPDYCTTYYVTVNISTGLTKPSDASLDIVNIKASAIPEKENPPENMRDKDFNTRWAAEGEQWAVFDLGSEKTVTGFGISIYESLAREQLMEIELSLDGENYTKILKGRTSRQTNEMEYISFSPVKARYVRLNGSGNSVNGWNSITEIEIFGK